MTEVVGGKRLWRKKGFHPVGKRKRKANTHCDGRFTAHNSGLLCIALRKLKVEPGGKKDEEVKTTS